MKYYSAIKMNRSTEIPAVWVDPKSLTLTEAPTKVYILYDSIYTTFSYSKDLPVILCIRGA